MPQKKYLNNVIFIRPLLIVLLVFYHSFAVYSGGWAPIEGFPEIRIYWFLDKLSYAFMLETFVFVSGYVFGYQVRTRGDDLLGIKSLFLSKFKRLIIPCILFSFLYILLYLDINQPVCNTLYDVFNGVGHMWFLPMLFWCFIFVGIIEKIGISPGWVLAFSLLLAIIPFPEIPLRIHSSFYYSPFFYSGFYIQSRNVSTDGLYKNSIAVASSLLFFVLFIILTYVSMHASSLFGSDNSYITKTVSNICRITYSTIGLIMELAIVGVLLSKKNVDPPSWLIEIGSLCFGVYLFQQFIIVAFYNYSTLPEVLGCYWLPWVVFFITLVCSLLLSYSIRKTRLGRLVI